MATVLAIVVLVLVAAPVALAILIDRNGLM